MNTSCIKILNFIKSNLLYVISAGLFLFSCGNDEKMPDFKFYSINEKWLSDQNFNDKNTVVVYFNTGCEYCQEELADFRTHYIDVKNKNVHIVFTSLETLPTIKSYVLANGLDTFENWYFTHSSPAQIDSLFHTATVPTIFVYKNGVLLERSDGQMPVEDILDNY